MTTPGLYLEISDGVTTPVTIGDGSGRFTKFSLARGGWAPMIARRRTGLMGGRSPYTEEIEELDLNVSGASASEAYANLEALNALLDQAQRWQQGKSVMAALLKLSPKGATVSRPDSPLQAALLGPAGDENQVALAPKFMQAGNYYVIEGVRARFARRGAWLGQTDSLTTSAVSSGDLAHSAFTTSQPNLCPVKVQIDNLTPGAALALPYSYLLVARNKAGTGDVNGAYLKANNANGMTATGYTAFADAANLPRGGTNVLRYTPTGTAYAPSGTLALASPITQSRKVAVYATVRKNTAARTFQIYGEFISNTAARAVQTDAQTIDTSSTQPNVIHLGTVSLPVDEINLPNVSYPTFKLYVAVDSTAGSPTLDIDALYFLGLDDEAGRAVGIQALTLPNQSNQDIIVDHNALTRPEPGVVLDIPGASQTDTLGYDGDPWLNTILDRITLCWVATRGAFWRYTNNAGTLQTQTFTAVRHRAYLSPV